MTEYLEDRIKKLEDLEARVEKIEGRQNGFKEDVIHSFAKRLEALEDRTDKFNVVLINKQVWEDIRWSVGALHRHTPLGSIYAMSRVSDLVTLIKKVDPDWSPVIIKP